jgi:hypothetical protein
MENPNLSQSIYGDLNAIFNSVAIIKNLVAFLPHVAPITFCHMDPTIFQVRTKDLCDAPHANLILLHFITTFFEFNMHLVMVEMIAIATTSHMD